MAWLGIEPATTRSRVRRDNHSATLPRYVDLLAFHMEVGFSNRKREMERKEVQERQRQRQIM